MKNKMKIVIINLVLLFLVIGGCEFFCYKSYSNQYQYLINSQAQMFDDPEEGKKILAVKYTKPQILNPQNYNKTKFEGTNESKQPIVTIGCSYTQGVGLEPNETFAAKLNELTGRTTYNRGVGGSGPQFVYYQLNDKSIKEDIPEAEYFIYTYIEDHLNRSFSKSICPFRSDFTPTYKIVNGKLQKNSDIFLYFYTTFMAKKYFEWYLNKETEKEIANGKPLFMKTMEESVALMKSKYPDAKFVLLEFPQNKQKIERFLNDKDKENLQNLGIIYLDARELVGHNYEDENIYRVEDKDHPSAFVWEELTPKIIERLNL